MTLSKILFGMLEATHQQPGRARRVRLKNGLEINVRYSADMQRLTMALSRFDVEPALAEWNACQNALPAHLRNLAITPRVQSSTDGDGRIYLGETWAVQDADPRNDEVRL